MDTTTTDPDSTTTITLDTMDIGLVDLDTTTTDLDTTTLDPDTTTSITLDTTDIDLLDLEAPMKIRQTKFN